MPTITQKKISDYMNALSQLKTLLSTMEELSKKKPDGPVNKFKLNHANEILDGVNAVLGEAYRPFKKFERFDVDGDLPSASDVVLMLAQYVAKMQKFEADHMIQVDDPDHPGLNWKVTRWNIST